MQSLAARQRAPASLQSVNSSFLCFPVPRTLARNPATLLSPGPENWEKIDVDLHTGADRFDFRALEEVVVKQGMIALQALDDHGGTNLGVKSKGFVAWGYCPNIVVFRRE